MASPINSPTSLMRLPTELIAQIFSHVHDTSPAPSSINLNQVPTSTFLTQPFTSTPLKNISLTSRHCRAIVLPLLFQHVIWHVDVAEIRSVWDALPDNHDSNRDHERAFPNFQFIAENSLAKWVRSVTLIITDEGDTRGLVLESGGDDRKTREARKANAWFWKTLLEVGSPRRLTIISPPRTMLGLLAPEGGYWTNDSSRAWHLLSLGLDEAGWEQPNDDSTTAHPRDEPKDDPFTSSLFALRPWTSVLLNEGSFLPNYIFPDPSMIISPSLLPPLLVVGSDPALFPKSAAHFTYIAQFPAVTHFRIIVDHLPKITNLNLQLVHAGVDLRTEPDPTCGNVKAWRERNRNYSLCLGELFRAPQNGNWKEVRVLESADQADGEAWRVAVGWAVEQGGGLWRVEGDGVISFEGRRAVGWEEDEDEEVIRPGALTRVAFRGTAPLPVSPVGGPRYGMPTGNYGP